ncbi:MAG: hypothetical protein GY800_01895 [Planctomycetes bacterium]|nr:hypothetical protein [Planctomycetota bacterium]
MNEASNYYKGSHIVGGVCPKIQGMVFGWQPRVAFQYIGSGKVVTILAERGSSCLLSEKNPSCQVKMSAGPGDPGAEVSLDVSGNRITVNYKITYYLEYSENVHRTGTIGSWQL